jgi:hypothetical protein
MLKGSCLCGGVRYDVDGPFELMAHCHCVQCRKASGADFATNATVNAGDFNLTAGDELLAEFESSPGNRRIFCRRCGSPIMKRVDDKPDKIRLRLGSLDGDPGVRPALHVFTSERPSWSEIRDDLPQFEKRPVPPKS